MEWLNPAYLAALAAVPAAAALFTWAAAKRRKARRLFGAAPVVSRLAEGYSPRRRRWKAALLTVAVGLIALALAGPRFGTKLREAKREGVDLVIALDVSASMLAEDVAPSRLARAKNEIRKLLAQLQGDRVGLVLFSGEAFIQCPLTTDYNAVRLFLDVAEPSLIPTPGTDFGPAIRTALHAFRARSAEPEEQARTRVLLVVSDGENHVADLDELLALAEEADVRIYTAGVGETGGAPIPVQEEGRREYKRNRQGEIVRTRLEEAALKELAREGAYFHIGRTSSSLPQLVPALERLEQTTLETRQFEEYVEQFQWPLALGLLLLALERLLPEMRARKTPEPVA